MAWTGYHRFSDNRSWPVEPSQLVHLPKTTKEPAELRAAPCPGRGAGVSCLREENMPEETPEAKKHDRSKSINAYWGIALTLLLTEGLV